MATKTFTFATNTTLPYTAEGGSWDATLGNASTSKSIIATDSSGQAGDTANCPQLDTAGKNKTSANYWEWSGTWEDLGVPAGATVQEVNLAYYWKCLTYTTGATGSTATGPAELRDSAGTLRNTFSTSLGFTTTSAWANRAGTNQTGLTDASSTSIKLRVNNNTSTGNSTSADVKLLTDYVVVTIIYSSSQNFTQTNTDAENITDATVQVSAIIQAATNAEDLTDSLTRAATIVRIISPN
jgi:hypothetical protein